MRKASIRELHIRTSEFVRAAENGEVIVIERRGQPVIELHPIGKKKRQIQFPDMRRFWEGPQIASDSTQVISEDRER